MLTVNGQQLPISDEALRDGVAGSGRRRVRALAVRMDTW